jgi:hypothetical protein
MGPVQKITRMERGNRGARKRRRRRRKPTKSFEYREFLGRNAFGVTVETARAEDVLAFIRGYWISRHVDASRTVAGVSGGKVVSMAIVKQTLQHVSKCYDMLGQEGSKITVKSEVVRAFKIGYRRMLHELGVCEKKAVVFKEGKLEDLVAFTLRSPLRRSRNCRKDYNGAAR